MAAEQYLTGLESNCLLNEVDRTTSPPETSNFYWKNDYGRKYKVFMPTPERKLYYTLEEYEGDMDIKKFDDNRMTFGTKCVRLAVSKGRKADQSFIDHMEFLIANLDEWNERNDELMSNVGGDVEDYKIDLYKHYVLNKYSVDDIRNIPIELRGIHAKIRSTISIHPSFDDAKVIYAMNMGFKLAAKRFANDENHEVYGYGRNNNGFSYY